MGQTTTKCSSSRWLDKFAISMAAVCAVHCLFTPVLIILLPIVATSFFVHQDFHLWMLFLVIPTTSLAVFTGCRKHKDKRVAVLSLIGLSVLLSAVAYERMQHVEPSALEEGSHICPHCVSIAESPFHPAAWINVAGGLFLAGAHVRNYRLCRKARCQH